MPHSRRFTLRGAVMLIAIRAGGGRQSVILASGYVAGIPRVTGRPSECKGQSHEVDDVLAFTADDNSIEALAAREIRVSFTSPPRALPAPGAARTDFSATGAKTLNCPDELRRFIE